jgi:hypothetical protein
MPGMHLDDVVRESVTLAEAFREHCRAYGYSEGERDTLRSHTNQTIRFNNSSISVLAQECDFNRTPPRFLLQPALRLRNQASIRHTGQMSPFGCYFIAFGTIAPPSVLERAFEHFETFFVDALGIPAHRLVLRGTADDPDLCALLRGARVPVEIDGCEQRLFRHRFGVDGVTGRNVNMAVISGGRLFDVANFIVMERDGEKWALETAFGINNIVTRVHQLAHPVLATAAACLQSDDEQRFIYLDALSSAVALALEGFKPQSRGREGNYRRFITALLPIWQREPKVLTDAVHSAMHAEVEIRRHISPARSLDLGADEAAEFLLAHIHYVAGCSEQSSLTSPGARRDS